MSMSFDQVVRSQVYVTSAQSHLLPFHQPQNTFSGLCVLYAYVPKTQQADSEIFFSTTAQEHFENETGQQFKTDAAT